MLETLDLEDLGLDEGAHLLIARALREHVSVAVRGIAPTLAVDLPAWCRAKGHAIARDHGVFAITRGSADRAVGAERAGTVATPVDHAPAHWGLAARGALVEAGAPALDLLLGSPLGLPLADKHLVWADEAARLY